MNKKFKIIFSTSILVLLVGFLFTLQTEDKRLHIYFCDVGQGDAIYIRFPNGQDMLIDGGPNNKILDCLSRHMPFYDRQINVVLLSHPQADHLSGLIPVIERYSVQYFVSSPAGNSSEGYQKLRAILQKKQVAVKNVFSGQKINFNEVSFKSIWPEREWVITHLNCGQSNSCQTIAAGSGSILGVQSTDPDLNDFSEMGILSYGSFDLLLAGDGDSRIQDEVLKSGEKVGDGVLEVMKVPHHGSKTALNSKFLEIFKPKLAVISVGKNSFGHPTSETINSLKALGAIVERTDQEGDIEIISDGKSWSIK